MALVALLGYATNYTVFLKENQPTKILPDGKCTSRTSVTQLQCNAVKIFFEILSAVCRDEQFHISAKARTFSFY